MLRRLIPALLLTGLVTVLPTGQSLPVAAQEAATLLAAYTLPDLPLAAFENAVRPGTVENDRGLLLGSTGSDLWHAAGDPPNEFWMMTDRGPNGLPLIDGIARRTFPVPDYTPLLLHVRTEADRIRILETLPLTGASGRPVTGMSNLQGRDEVPWDYAAQTQFDYNPSGLDPEGLVRTSKGEFWLVDEYGPSVVKVVRDGRVLKRLLPENVDLTTADYPAESVLPPILSTRKGNRGFEGVAISQDERLLYIVLQSPLSNPTKLIGDPSRNTRVLVFDTVSERMVAEYAYRFELATDYDPLALPADLKLSAVVTAGPNRLLILERTDAAARVYLVDLTQATNILGSAWDDPATTPSLEALDDPAGANLVVLPKTLVADLSQVAGTPPKIEGLALVDRQTLAIANDNDFDFSGFDENGQAIPIGLHSQLQLIGLAAPLPIPR